MQSAVGDTGVSLQRLEPCRQGLRGDARSVRLGADPEPCPPPLDRRIPSVLEAVTSLRHSRCYMQRLRRLCALQSYRLIWDSPFLGRKTNLTWSFVGCEAPVSEPRFQKPRVGDVPRFKNRELGRFLGGGSSGGGGLVGLGRVRVGVGAVLAPILRTGACRPVRLPSQEQPNPGSRAEFAAVSHRRRKPRRQWEQPRSTPRSGHARPDPTPGSRPRATTAGSGAMEAGPAPPLREQSDLQRYEPEPLLRERCHAMGVRLGSVPRPHVWTARREADEERASVRRKRSARGLRERRGRHRFQPFGRRRPEPETTPREQLNTSARISTPGPCTVAPERLEWLREGPVDGDMSTTAPTYC